MVRTYQGRTDLLEEVQKCKPPGNLKAFPPFVFMVSRADRPATWHVQAVPDPLEAGPPPRVTIWFIDFELGSPRQVAQKFQGSFAKDRLDQVWAKLQSLQKDKVQEEVNSKQLAHLRRLFVTCRSVLGPDALPGDMEEAIRAETDHQEMFKADPGYRALSLHGKYGPWKDVLFKAWLDSPGAGAHGVPGVPGGSLADDPGRAERVHGVLLAAVRLMAQVPAEERQVWTQHVGRKVCRHHGYLVMLQDLGILLPPGSAPSPGPAPVGMLPVLLSAGQAGKAHILVTDLSPELKLKLLAYLDVADQLAALSIPAPTTCEDWVNKYALFAQLVADIPMAPHCPGPYRLPWLWRSACLARMRFEGIQRLVAPDVGLAAFRKSFPDQHEWMDVLGQGHLSLAEFMKYLEYDGEPELLTMRLCLHFDADLILYRPEWLWANRAWLQQRLQERRGQLGFYPHLAHILQELREFWNCHPWTEDGGMPMGVLQGRGPGVPGVPEARDIPARDVVAPAPEIPAPEAEPGVGVSGVVPAPGAARGPLPKQRLIGKGPAHVKTLPPPPGHCPQPPEAGAQDQASSAGAAGPEVSGVPRSEPALAVPQVPVPAELQLPPPPSPKFERPPKRVEKPRRMYVMGMWQTPPEDQDTNPQAWTNALLGPQPLPGPRQRWPAGKLCRKHSGADTPQSVAATTVRDDCSDSDVEAVPEVKPLARRLDFGGDVSEARPANQPAAARAAASTAAAGAGDAGIAAAASMESEKFRRSLESSGALTGAEAEGPSPQQLPHLKRKAEHIIGGDRSWVCGDVWGF